MVFWEVPMVVSRMRPDSRQRRKLGLLLGVALLITANAVASDEQEMVSYYQMGDHELLIPVRNAANVNATPFFGVLQEKPEQTEALNIVFDPVRVKEAVPEFVVSETMNGELQNNIVAVLMYLDDENLGRVDSIPPLARQIWDAEGPYSSRRIAPVPGAPGLYRAYYYPDADWTWVVFSADPNLDNSLVDKQSVYLGACTEGSSTHSCFFTTRLGIPGLAITVTIAELSLTIRDELLAHIEGEVRSWIVPPLKSR